MGVFVAQLHVGIILDFPTQSRFLEEGKERQAVVDWWKAEQWKSTEIHRNLSSEEMEMEGGRQCCCPVSHLTHAYDCATERNALLDPNPPFLIAWLFAAPD